MSIVFFVSCKEKELPKSTPRVSLVKNYKVKEGDILYQYYEKFGSTDICIHGRTYFKHLGAINIKDWKKMPIDKNDLAKINEMANKVDDFDGTHLGIVYAQKDFFSDISLEAEEYIKDSSIQEGIVIHDGFYRINARGNKVEFYFSKYKTIFQEYHTCSK